MNQHRKVNNLSKTLNYEPLPYEQRGSGPAKQILKDSMPAHEHAKENKHDSQIDHESSNLCPELAQSTEAPEEKNF